MSSFIQRVMNPDWYHGHGKKAPYFEGWYYKVINAAEDTRYAFIPGIFLNRDANESHAFIQALDGMTGKASYHRYPVGEFQAKIDDFDVHIGPNHFRRECILLDIDDEGGRFKGELHFDGVTPWPVSWASPGIMGWYGWIPIMECYHGVVSLNHTLRGSLKLNGTSVDFTGGIGYMEKDWGSNFPSGYVWQQTNHFDQPGTSLTASIAVIPNLGLKFPGFIIGFWHNQQLYRFATYTGAKVRRLHVTDDTVHWIVRDRQFQLEMTSTRARGGLLMGPEKTAMHMRVDETLQAQVHVRLSRLSGDMIFDGTGRNAGLEVVGDLRMLLKE